MAHAIEGLPRDLETAVIDVDGTMVTTSGERKEGIDINYKKEWGYHPFVVSLANTGELLYLVNRSGNRPSHEGATREPQSTWIVPSRIAGHTGFRKVRLRGDTDFSQTAHLDRWTDDEVTFVFGFDAIPKWYELAESLPKSAWKELPRPQREIKTKPRRRPNFKQKIVEEQEYTDLQTVAEHVAEFTYQPGNSWRAYRVIVVWKDQREWKGQNRLFDTERCFFYITNDWTTSIGHSASGQGWTLLPTEVTCSTKLMVSSSTKPSGRSQISASCCCKQNKPKCSFVVSNYILLERHRQTN